MEFREYDLVRYDMESMKESLENDNLDIAINKNFGIYPKKNVIRMFINRRNSQ